MFALLAIRAFLGKIFNFLIEHPIIIVIITVGVGCGAIGWVQGGKHVAAQYEPIVAAYKKDAEDRAAKIAQIEEESRRAAQQAETEIKEKVSETQKIVDNYEALIDGMKKNPKIKVVTVTVKEPNGTDKPVDLFVEPDGEVSCRRLPSAFTDTINSMVDIANRKFTPGAKTDENIIKPISISSPFDDSNPISLLQPTSRSWGQEHSGDRQEAASVVQRSDQSQEWFGRGPETVGQGDSGFVRRLLDTTEVSGEHHEEGFQHQLAAW